MVHFKFKNIFLGGAMNKNLQTVERAIVEIGIAAIGGGYTSRKIFMEKIQRVMFDLATGDASAKTAVMHLSRFINGVHLCKNKKGFCVMPIENCMVKRRKNKEDPPDIKRLKGSAMIVAFALEQCNVKVKIISQRRKDLKLVCWV